MPPQEYPELKPLHPDALLSEVKLGFLRALSTEGILRSLLPSADQALRVRPEGTILNGHHRIKVLRERGVEVDALPREIIPRPDGPDQVREDRGGPHSDVYWIDGVGSHRVAVAARPRGGDGLSDEASWWSARGVGLVVSLLTYEEIVELELEDESEECAKRDILFSNFPIMDRTVPSYDDVEPILVAIHQFLSDGLPVLVHCRSGIGRATLLVAALLARVGLEPGVALERIEAARGCRIPDTEEQRRWILARSAVSAV
ncbi:MAG: hypothetical protein O2923_12290 [Verrucomicrobia bacterium]|nr:hypothetical protein [Verrucomicrobiota bacterium]MDA1085394.1 hypothetical protein [Verrucomicrobiota bacterium]